MSSQCGVPKRHARYGERTYPILVARRRDFEEKGNLSFDLALFLLLPACGEAMDNESPTAAVSGGTSGGDSDASVPGFVSWEDAGLTDHVMDWGDDALAEKMVKETGITDRDIMLSDVWELDMLILGGGGVSHISNISALGELTNLWFLSLALNDITDISPLSSLTNLKRLYLDRNNIKDVSALSGLTNLEYLDVGGNIITDFSPVEFVPTLCKGT